MVGHPFDAAHPADAAVGIGLRRLAAPSQHRDLGGEFGQVLVALADGKLVCWYYPTVVFVDRDLLPLTIDAKDATPKPRRRPKKTAEKTLDQLLEQLFEANSLKSAAAATPAQKKKRRRKAKELDVDIVG